jgi:hypothetical protein
MIRKKIERKRKTKKTMNKNNQQKEGKYDAIHPF